jgi:putative FmdB family regulatory protein
MFESRCPVPLFEFDCLDCGNRFEALVRGTAEPACPRCQSRVLARVLSTFAVNTPGTSQSAFDRARKSHRKNLKEQEFYEHHDHDDDH